MFPISCWDQDVCLPILTISVSTHIPVVVRPADGQEPLDRGAHDQEDGAAHRDPEYKGGGKPSYWDKLLTTDPIISIV